ncbi:MAG TPA: bifunctional serine/threonine-protein kinase/formylglycine-generating enzyme family protein [Kofleriaceae bacterium]|nr:bifunctional serine/threonine-protein kinase/formylglycine-generating enzyme family protein [Kofleriaceae bacterium]
MGTRHVDWVPPESFDEYRLIEALGRGSMGQVWLARDTLLDRLVAVKFISELPAADAVRQRFLIEARAAARVQHPNIIAIFRVGEIGPRPFLISEYVPGERLDRIPRPVPAPRLLHIALGLARGLAAAHHHGVLHRDLKPANAILARTGEVKLLDFGLAKLTLDAAEPPPARAPDLRPLRAELPGDPTTPPRATPGAREAIAAPSNAEGPTEPADEPDEDDDDGDDSERDETVAPVAPVASVASPAPAPSSDRLTLPGLTSTGAVIGTPAYMPPEAWRGEPSTPRSDVYSLGALLYELAAGAPPHRADSHAAMRSAAVDSDAPPLATAAPGLDPRLAAIIDRCLARDPEGRYASGEAVRDALEALAAGPPLAAAPARPAPAGQLPGRARAWRPLGAAAAVLVALGFALVADYVLEGALPGSPAARCPDSMVVVPAGSFEMGSLDGVGEADEHPRHRVTLSAFCLDRTEVTVMAYAACVVAGACSPPPGTVNWPSYSAEDVRRFSRSCNDATRPDHPINCVDWDSAAAYCAWRGTRLPTEAEWEYAARGGDDRAYPWGDGPPDARHLNACGAECGALARRERIPWRPMHDEDDGWETTAPVGSYPQGASRSGALDMAGNVWEWTSDIYGPYPRDPVTNPQGATRGTSRVSRGGGWTSGGDDRARAADRDWFDPKVRESSLGFRCARTRARAP